MLYNCKAADLDLDVKDSACRFEKLKFEYQQNSYGYAIISTFRLSNLPRQEPSATIDIPVCFYK